MSEPSQSVPPSRPPAVPRADYLLWAKRRPHPANDLGRSDVVACTLADLPGAREALELTGRNDEGWEPLVQRVAARYGVRPDQVATATGTSGANFLVCAALLRPGDDVLVEQPAYDPLLAVPALLGANVIRFERRFEEGFRLDLDRVAAALTPRTRLIVVTNPHNPTGVLTGADDLRALGALAERHGCYVLADEVYLDAVPGAAAARGGDAVAAHHHDGEPDEGVRPGRAKVRVGAGRYACSARKSAARGTSWTEPAPCSPNGRRPSPSTGCRNSRRGPGRSWRRTSSASKPSWRANPPWSGWFRRAERWRFRVCARWCPPMRLPTACSATSTRPSSRAGSSRPRPTSASRSASRKTTSSAASTRSAVRCAPAEFLKTRRSAT